MKKTYINQFLFSSIFFAASPLVAIISCSNSNSTTETTSQQLSLKSSSITLVGFDKENAKNYGIANRLKKLIFNQRNNIFNNIPLDFAENDLLLDNILPNNPEIGSLKVDLEVRKNQQSLIKATVIFNGFSKNVFALKASEIKLEGQSDVDPKDYYDIDELQKFIFSQREQIFINQPDDFAENHINIKPDSIKIRSGALLVTLVVNSSNPTLGQLIMPTEIKLTGFKTILAFKNSVISLSNVSDQLANSFDKNKIKKLVVAKAGEIFDNLPVNETISEEQVLIDDQQKAIMANGQTLSVKLALKEKTSENLLINYETITLTGFKIAIELNNNGYIPLSLDPGEENSNQYLDQQNGKLKALIYKNRNVIFKNWPDNFNENSFEITSIDVSTLENQQYGKLILKIKVADPYGGSDLITETDLVLDGFFDLIQNNFLLKLKTGEGSIEKYYNSESESTEEEKMALANLIFNYKETIFINIPMIFSSEQIQIQSIRKDSSGILGINLQIFQNNDKNSLLLNTKEIFIDGFFDFASGRVNLASSLTDAEKPGSQYQDINNGAIEKLINLVWNHKNQIFVNLPENFVKEGIKIIKPAAFVAGTSNIIEIELEIKSGNEILLKLAKIQLIGFTNTK